MAISDVSVSRLEKNLGTSRLIHNSFLTFGQREVEVELLTEAHTLEELTQAIRAARMSEVPFSILGIGCRPSEKENTISGLVIKNNCRKFDMLSMRGKVESGQTETEFAFITAETGVSLNQLVRYSLDVGLGGLEDFLGIGGTLGDNLMQNTLSGENEYLTANIYSLQFLSRENEVLEVEAEPFLYPLRENMMIKNNVIPLSVVFKLIPSEKSELWKKATEAAFKRNESELLDPMKGNFNY
jgi:UDP-N-acetylenolpyruvoylglucosamine reductase